jgi:hypothetical protein
MKEKFTSQEWEQLKLLPFQVFVMVAGADSKIDEKEIEQLQADLRTAPFYKDPLHRDLFVDILTSDIMALIKKAMDVSGFVERATQIKGILKAKLSTDEYQRFVASMFVNGIKVANASGGGFLGRGSKISPEEQRALLVFASLYELDPGSTSKFFS